jgi:rhodanese-related sulfurtransferase
LGYNVTNLKYGMMGWTPNEEIVGQPGFKGGGGYQVETEPHELPEAVATPPSFKTGQQEAVQIILARAQELLPDWSPVVTADKLFENLADGDDTNNPFIIDVRKPEDYARGHVPGAVNVFWTGIAAQEVLAKLPADRQIVTYCYTGHTGEAAAVALMLLGYNVTNLKFAIMGWTDNEEVVGQPIFKGAADYAVETEPHPFP